MLHHHSTIKDAKFVEYIAIILPLILASNALNTIRTLSYNLKTIDIRRLIFPSIIAFFVPPLVANLVYPQFIVNNTVLISFFIAILTFPILSRFPIVLFWVSNFGRFFRFLFLKALRDNAQPISHVTLWPILSDFVGIFVMKILSGKKDFMISEKILINTLSSAIIVYFARTLDLGDSSLIFTVLFVEISTFAFNKFTSMGKMDSSTNMGSLLHIFSMQNKQKENKSFEEVKATKPKPVEQKQAESKTKPLDSLEDPLETNTIRLDEEVSNPETTSKKRRGRPKKSTLSKTSKQSKNVSKRK